MNRKFSKSFFFLLIITAIGLPGLERCNTSDFSRQKNEIDTMLVALVDIKAELLLIDSAEVIKTIILVNKDFNFVRDSFPGELIGQSSEFLGQLKVAKKFSDNFNAAFPRLKNEVDYSLKQLDNLKADLKNKSINEKDATQYLNDEKRAFQTIKAQSDRLFYQLNSVNNKYLISRDRFYIAYSEYKMAG